MRMQKIASMMNQSTTISRDIMLETLKKNRIKHAEELSLAMEQYKLTLKEKLVDLKEVLNSGELNAHDCHHDIQSALLEHFIDVSKPQDNLKEYDNVIMMVEMNPEENITISFDQFKMWVKDEWSWKRNFGQTMTSNAGYLAGKGLI
jgi:hypothetical protein